MRCSAALPLCVASCLLLPACTPFWHTRQSTLKVSLPGPADPEAVAAAEELLEEAEHLLDHDKPEKARQRLEEAIRLDPACGPAYNNLGLIYFSWRQLYEAANAFSSAIDLMPGSGVPHNNLGLTLDAGGRGAEAIVHFEQAFALDPTNPEFLGNLVRARIASGDVGDEVVAMLEQLVFLDSRPEWVAWANEELALQIPKTRLASGDVMGAKPAEMATPTLRGMPPTSSPSEARPSESAFVPPLPQAPPAAESTTPPLPVVP